MAKKRTSKENLELLQKYLPALMDSKDFNRKQVIEKLDKLQKNPQSWTDYPTDWNEQPVFPLYEALADPEAAHSYFAPYKYSPEVNEDINKFSADIGRRYPYGKNIQISPETTPPPADGKPPAGQPPTDGVPPAQPKAPAAPTTSSTTAPKTVSQRITELEARGGGRKVLELDAEVPAGFEMVSMLAGRKVIMPRDKTATGETIPEVSQESLRKSLATRTGPDYASESTTDLMDRARQARAIVNGVTETAMIGGQRVARDEYNKIRQTLADRKTTNAANAATAAVQASADRIKNYGEARDKYQAGMSTDDKTFQSLDENKERLWNSMTSGERSQAVNNIELKAQAADKAAAAAQTSKPAQTPKPSPIEEEKKKALRTARSIFGK